MDQADAPQMIYESTNAEVGNEAEKNVTEQALGSDDETETDFGDSDEFQDSLDHVAEEVMYAFTATKRVGGEPDPPNEDEARESKNRKEWLAAEDEEYQSLIEEDVLT